MLILKGSAAALAWRIATDGWRLLEVVLVGSIRKVPPGIHAILSNSAFAGVADSSLNGVIPVARFRAPPNASQIRNLRLEIRNDLKFTISKRNSVQFEAVCRCEAFATIRASDSCFGWPG
jgi:hypothetical protein